MTRKSRWAFLAILFGLSLILRHEVLFLFTVLLALASGASALWFRFCLDGVSYRRKLDQERIFPGEEIELSIEVTNAKPLPLAWLLIRDDFPKGLSLLTGALHRQQGPASQSDTPVLSLTDMLSLRWYERVERTYRIRGQKRGVYAFGPVDLTSGDIFGFGQKHICIEGLDPLMIYPKVVPIDQLGLPSEFIPAEKPAGEFKARRKVIEDPLRLATVREYMPGDSIRHIHWKNTARLSKLQTKVFDPSASPVLVIFADLQTVHNPYSFVSEYLELIIASTASIAIHALDQRQAVGLYVNGGPSGSSYWTSVPPGRSSGQGPQILSALAPLSGFRLLPLAQLLRRSMPSLPYGSTVLAVTARPVEETMISLLTLQDAGHPILLLTVGDQVPEIPSTFTAFHLGGRDAWRRLETLELA
jgi:uncharacterized protein (DUF58 family)